MSNNPPAGYRKIPLARVPVAAPDTSRGSGKRTNVALPPPGPTSTMSATTQPPRLRVVTFEHPAIHELERIDPAPFENPDAPTPHPCDGTYRCSCPACDAEREHRVRQGVRRRKRQPWETNAA